MVEEVAIVNENGFQETVRPSTETETARRKFHLTRSS